MQRLSVINALAAAAAAMLWAAPAAAQSQAPATAQQQAAPVSEEDLRAYAAAALEVRRIGGQWQPRIQAAPDNVTRAELQQQAQAEMIQAVDEEGLSVQQYNRIYRLAQNDPAVREQVIAYMQQAE